MTLVQCPLCQKKIRVTEKISGRKVRCKCNNVLRMPKLPELTEVSEAQDMVYEPERITPVTPAAASPVSNGPPILFGCPSCSAELRVNSELAGKVARCRCGTRIQVPMPIVQEAYGLEPLEGGEELFEGGDQLFGMAADDPFSSDPYAAPDPYADDDLFGPTGGDSVLGGQPAYLGGSPAGNPYKSPASKTVKKKKKRNPSKRKSQSGGFSIDGEVIGGVLAMIGAIVWFVAGLAGGVIFFYPPVLFFIGLAGVVKGLLDGD